MEGRASLGTRCSSSRSIYIYLRFDASRCVLHLLAEGNLVSVKAHSDGVLEDTPRLSLLEDLGLLEVEGCLFILARVLRSLTFFVGSAR